MEQSLIDNQEDNAASGEGLGHKRNESLEAIKDQATQKTLSVNDGEMITERIANLKSAVTNNYIADVNKAKGRVEELIHNQEVLRESIQQEMTNLNEYKLTDDITEFVTELEIYHSKLKNMRRDIQYASDKVSKLKRRSTKLRVNKEKEERQIEENKRKELELQQELTAKPAAQSFDH